jgi:SnoaL-like polyketide cyclase
MSTTAPTTDTPPTLADTPPTLEQQDGLSLDQLRGGLQGFSERWLPRVDELHGFFERWDQAWNTHDLDLLGTLVTEDILCDDPAMFGQTVESREEFLAFLEDLFRAFPDVRFQATGDLYLALGGGGIALPWRMTGSFTGELRTWSKNREAQPHTTQPTGKTFDLEGVDLYEFRDGLLTNYSIVYDLLGFSAQIGLMG